jgi:hypothetical protein
MNPGHLHTLNGPEVAASGSQAKRFMPTRQPLTTSRRQQGVASACRIAFRILENGGEVAEALRFLANAFSRYLGAPIAIVSVSPDKEDWPAAAAAEPAKGFFDEPDCPSSNSCDVVAPATCRSMPVYSTAGRILAEIRVYNNRLADDPAEDAVLLRSLADAVARILK